MKYDSIIFDLDGTLWDTCESCAIAWNNVVKRNNISFRRIVAEDVRSVAGRSHEQCIRDTFIGISESELKVLISETSEEDNVMVEKLGGHLYDGVLDGLSRLKLDYPLFIVSNCQDGYIETFLRFSNTNATFNDFESWGRSGKPKFQNIIDVIERNNLINPVYIGDTDGDKKAAIQAGVDFIYVDYGYGRLSNEVEFSDFSSLVNYFINRQLSNVAGVYD